MQEANTARPLAATKIPIGIGIRHRDRLLPQLDFDTDSEKTSRRNKILTDCITRPPHREFNVWSWGDTHVGTELRHGISRLADVLRASEDGGPDKAPAIPWDIAIDVGDMSGGQGVPEDEEGEEIVRQFGVLKNHPREAVYNICGNHDRSGLAEPAAWWWRKWLDPLGEQPQFSGVRAERRPFPVSGTWERYSFRVGNLLFLMMSDINEPSQKIGRGELGGNPAGVVSGETFDWWKEMVMANPDSIIVSAHHYMLKDTTVASGDWEGMDRDAGGNWCSGYHGYKPQGEPRGASYLFFVGSRPDSGAFENFLAANPGRVAVWLGGHTHAHPDAAAGGKGHIETRWGTHFINVAALTRHHICRQYPNPPKSRLLTFTDGGDELRVRCYMHTDEFLPRGWYAPAERRLRLPKPFRLSP